MSDISEGVESFSLTLWISETIEGRFDPAETMRTVMRLFKSTLRWVVRSLLHRGVFLRCFLFYIAALVGIGVWIAWEIGDEGYMVCSSPEDRSVSRPPICPPFPSL